MYPVYYLRFPKLHVNTSAAIPVHQLAPRTPPKVTKLPLLEPSFADALDAIEKSTELSPQKRSQWASALRQIAKALDKPMATLPARWTSARFNVERLHPAMVGANAKTLANQKSNVKAALRWYGQEHDVSPRGTPLTPPWALLRDAIGGTGRKRRLYGLIRYCSARNIEPQAVSNATLDEYFRYRKQTTALATNAAARRSVARAWNVTASQVASWPQQRLTEPPLQVADRVPWEAFPNTLRAQIDDYLASFASMRRGRNGKRIRPNKASSKRTRRAEIVAFVRKAVEIGIPIDDITDLSKLLHPNVVERVINSYTEDGETISTYAIDLGWKFCAWRRSREPWTKSGSLGWTKFASYSKFIGEPG